MINVIELVELAELADRVIKSIHVVAVGRPRHY